MKSIRLFSLVPALALTLFLALTTNHAAAAKPKTPPPPPEDDRKLIKLVNVKTSEVVIVYKHDGSTHTYKVDFATVLKVNNSAGKIEDLKPGMVVDDYVERDNENLDSLSVSGKR